LETKEYERHWNQKSMKEIGNKRIRKRYWNEKNIKEIGNKTI
jgi:hypothetical protein